MNLLLDTHIWIWANSRPEKLSRVVRRQLENPRNELYLSPVSIWEVGHMIRKESLQIKGSFSEWIKEFLSRMPVREAPLTFAAASEAAGIHLPQNDPADVFLAATACACGFTLVTSDPQLIACSWLKTLANH
jgi:PIN domain nuclease of toxin-antitoxin system